MKDFTGIVSDVALKAPPRLGPTLAQRRIQTIVALRLSPATSDRALAAYCGVSRELVARLRAELVALGRIVAAPKRVALDHKAYRPKKGGDA